MPIKEYKPTSNARRGMTGHSFDGLSKKKPEKSLLVSKKRKSGRSSSGRIAVRRSGGGHKRKYRIIDFKRTKDGIPARVRSIEYDPNRSARIALLVYADGEKRYILAPMNLKEGDVIESGTQAKIKTGNNLPISHIPVGTIVHCIELKPGKGAQIVRSAGNYAHLVAKEGKHAHIRLPSGEIRLVQTNCRATVGQVGNAEHENVTLGKAGRSRWLGNRPTVRGVAMNPIDHPHGGGEGKSKGNHPVTPWGQPTKGYKTRRKKASDKMIVQRRKNRKR